MWGDNKLFSHRVKRVNTLDKINSFVKTETFLVLSELNECNVLISLLVDSV